jgi:eukaryotic-like serine/threonine-protein kinase
MLKELRLKGLSEEAMQSFVCRFTGEDWEEFFEQLFGYEAMIEARGRWASADRANPRHKFATWREPLVRWIERIETARQEAKENKELARVEKERLKAEGISEADAEKQARKPPSVPAGSAAQDRGQGRGLVEVREPGRSKTRFSLTDSSP